jgi:hypothetical protein
MSRKIAGAAALLLLASAPAWANTSLYTPTDGAACKTMREDAIGAENGGMTDWSCPAPKGFKAFFTAADFYEGVRLAREVQKPPKSDYFGVHGKLGEKLEWRLAPDGVPVAAILRFTADEVDGSGTMHPGAPKLLVMKITKQGSCPVGQVAANRPNANEAAREFADRVTPATPCDSALLPP